MIHAEVDSNGDVALFQYGSNMSSERLQSKVNEHPLNLPLGGHVSRSDALVVDACPVGASPLISTLLDRIAWWQTSSQDQQRTKFGELFTSSTANWLTGLMASDQCLIGSRGIAPRVIPRTTVPASSGSSSVVRGYLLSRMWAPRTHADGAAKSTMAFESTHNMRLLSLTARPTQISHLTIRRFCAESWLLLPKANRCPSSGTALLRSDTGWPQA